MSSSAQSSEARRSLPSPESAEPLRWADEDICPYVVRGIYVDLDYFAAGGTYSLGGAAPSPKKYCSICLTIAVWSSRRAGFSRYSFSNILQNSVHPFHASRETLS